MISFMHLLHFHLLLLLLLLHLLLHDTNMQTYKPLKIERGMLIGPFVLCSLLLLL